MKNRTLALLLAGLLTAGTLVSCGSTEDKPETNIPNAENADAETAGEKQSRIRSRTPISADSRCGSIPPTTSRTRRTRTGLSRAPER